MEEGRVGFIQSGGGKDAAAVEGEAVNNPPPPQPPLAPTAPTTYEPLPSKDDPSTTDPLVEASTISSIDKTLVSTRDISNDQAVVSTKDIGKDLDAESNLNLVIIDEIINTSGGTTAEAHYVELSGNGKTNMNLLSTRLISKGGGGKNH
ncbi:hypothetical protein L2E82_26507 [Cichorium intybus]|uniref:Uncharacterized protein n=1 Tax=Cichorium intybus TaxID=13427 RepID=A0ACB9CQV7_CICIN|nr:hypothetical protein L2E82_26507 [Cichorium intybus]